MIGVRKSRAQVAAVAAAFLGLFQVSLNAGASGVSSDDPGASQATARRVEGFWTQDVWADPSRPFLFYGEKREDEVKSREDEVKSPTEKRAVEGMDRSKAGGEGKKSASHVSDGQLAIFPADGLDRAAAGETLTREAEAAGLERLRSFKTIKELREEVDRRMDAAVMNPTPAAIGLYLQANAFLMQKAGVFAESWRRALVDNPQFDWTAVRPAVNVVSTGMSREREGRMMREVRLMAKDHGFIFFGDDTLKTRHMLEQVRAFQAEYGFDAAFVSVSGANNPLMPEARDDKGLSAFVAQGVRQFPALVLVSRFEKDLTKAKLIATGAADAMTLVRNTHAAANEMLRDRASAAGDSIAAGLKAGQTAAESALRGSGE